MRLSAAACLLALLAAPAPGLEGPEAAAGLGAAAHSPRSGPEELLASSGAAWSDGTAARPSLTAVVPGRESAWRALAPASGRARLEASDPPEPEGDEPPLPGNDAAAEIGFSAVFLAVESPAIGLMQVPYVGEVLGGLLALALLVPALIAGGVGALVGWLFF